MSPCYCFAAVGLAVIAVVAVIVVVVVAAAVVAVVLVAAVAYVAAKAVVVGCRMLDVAFLGIPIKLLFHVLVPQTM